MPLDQLTYTGNIRYRCIDMPNFNLNNILQTYKSLRKNRYNLHHVYLYTESQLDDFLRQYNTVYNNIYENNQRSLLYLHGFLLSPSGGLRIGSNFRD